MRYPRGAGLGVPLTDSLETLPVGKAEVLQEEGNIAFTVGTMVEKARKQPPSSRRASRRPSSTCASSSRSIQSCSARSSRPENVLASFISAVAEYLADHGIEVPLLPSASPDRFIEQGTRREGSYRSSACSPMRWPNIRERLSQMDENA